MNEEQQYLNFDEYIKASEPHKRERAEAWRVAIGLQAVDGLQVSEYLKQTARQHIEGEITIDEAIAMIRQHYASRHSNINTYEIVPPSAENEREILEYNKTIRPELYKSP